MKNVNEFTEENVVGVCIFHTNKEHARTDKHTYAFSVCVFKCDVFFILRENTHEHTLTRTYIYTFSNACRVTYIRGGNGCVEVSSNPGLGYWHFD